MWSVFVQVCVTPNQSVNYQGEQPRSHHQRREITVPTAKANRPSLAGQLPKRTTESATIPPVPTLDFPLRLQVFDALAHDLPEIVGIQPVRDLNPFSAQLGELLIDRVEACADTLMFL